MLLLTTLLSSKISAAVLAAGVVVAGGTGVAAYADVLPDPLQQTAHDLIGAPAPETTVEAEADAGTTSVSTAGDASTDATSTEEASTGDTTTGGTETTATGEPTADPTTAPVGPDATGPAAHGLCEAYTHGGLSVSSVAYASLEKAAGSAEAIVDYCASIPAPGHAADHKTAAKHDVTVATDAGDVADDVKSTDATGADADTTEADNTDAAEVTTDATVQETGDATEAGKPAQAANAHGAAHTSVKAGR